MAISRRRFLTIAAGGSAAALASFAGPYAAASAPVVIWRGIALGAPAKIVLDGENTDAEAILSEIIGEIDRLENLFSLYRSGSAISILNRTGQLANPDPDVLAILSISDRIFAASQGAFDPTVQPAWAALAARQVGRSPIPETPVSANWRAVVYSSERVSFEQKGMAITLNGIAQGYITDRVAQLMFDAGFDHVLVDMGELRTTGLRKDGTAWPVSIAGTDGARSKRLRLRGGRALAVSQSKGTTFDGEGRLGHILNPQTGEAVERDRLVAVEAEQAVLADGLSTALCLIDPPATDTVLRQFPGSRLVIDSDA